MCVGNTLHINLFRGFQKSQGLGNKSVVVFPQLTSA